MDTDGLSYISGVGSLDLLLGYDDEVSQWVANQLGITRFVEYSAIGVISNNTILAGIVFYNYRHPNIEASIASINPRWCSRKILKLVFDYPFNQLGCTRVTVHVDSNNKIVQKFDERLGFVHEGTMRKAHGDTDAEIYGMLKSECRWI